MGEMGSLAIGQKIFEIYGPMALGWFAWFLTMIYLQFERRRYQTLVITIVQYFTKVRMQDDVEFRFPDNKPQPRIREKDDA